MFKAPDMDWIQWVSFLFFISTKLKTSNSNYKSTVLYILDIMIEHGPRIYRNISFSSLLSAFYWMPRPKKKKSTQNWMLNASIK